MRNFLLIILYLFFLKTALAKEKTCTFCKREVVELQSVFQTPYYNVILDYEPHVKGHLLVIPKRHVFKAHELTIEEWDDLGIVIPKVVQVFSKFLGTDQYIILEKNGRNAFQQIPHVHFHLFPIHHERWSKIFDTWHEKLTPEELEKQTNLFRDYFLRIDLQ